MEYRERLTPQSGRPPHTRSEAKKAGADSQERTDSRVHHKCAFEIFVLQNEKCRVSEARVSRLSIRSRALKRGPKLQKRAAADVSRRCGLKAVPAWRLQPQPPAPPAPPRRPCCSSPDAGAHSPPARSPSPRAAAAAASLSPPGAAPTAAARRPPPPCMSVKVSRVPRS